MDVLAGGRRGEVGVFVAHAPMQSIIVLGRLVGIEIEKGVRATRTACFL